jgi:hypothetical protein
MAQQACYASWALSMVAQQNIRKNIMYKITLENFLQSVERQETMSETLNSLDVWRENDNISQEDNDEIAEKYLSNTL